MLTQVRLEQVFEAAFEADIRLRLKRRAHIDPIFRQWLGAAQENLDVRKFFIKLCIQSDRLRILDNVRESGVPSAEMLDCIRSVLEDNILLIDLAEIEQGQEYVI